MTSVHRPFDRRTNFADETKRKLLVHHTVSPTIFAGLAIGDLGGIALLATLGSLATRSTAPVAWVALNVPILLLIASRQRGLQNLVHDGSHFNASRSRRLNDWLVDLLAALPMLTRVGTYRVPHRSHHLFLGSDKDPDRGVYENYAIDQIDRGSLTGFLKTVRLGLYFALPPTRGGRVDWVSLALGLAWHGLVVVAPLAVVLGPSRAILGWIGYWIVPMFAALPLIRFVAESGKHVYEGRDHIVEGTVSNLGLIHQGFLHPHGDGYHLLHHLDPAIPCYRLPAAHRLLVKIEPEQYGARFLFRDRVIAEPRTASPRPQEVSA